MFNVKTVSLKQKFRIMNLDEVDLATAASKGDNGV